MDRAILLARRPTYDCSVTVNFESLSSQINTVIALRLLQPSLQDQKFFSPNFLHFPFPPFSLTD